MMVLLKRSSCSKSWLRAPSASGLPCCRERGNVHAVHTSKVSVLVWPETLANLLPVPVSVFRPATIRPGRGCKVVCSGTDPQRIKGVR